MTPLPEKQRRHPYLHGNFAPIHKIQSLTPCSYTGTIPEELAGGEYVRNGGNPVTNEDLGRDAHSFDGDGMLSGVTFTRKEDGSVRPEFVNQYILTDVYLSTLTTPSLRLPILPSIATLVNPASSLFTILLRIFRTIFLIILSYLPGSQQAIKKLSVANTGFLFHDGRALATCESGPPMRISLPGLETVGWFNGDKTEGEPVTDAIAGESFGGEGIIGWMREWTTAHPRVDPITKDLILFHSTFVAPFVHYSIIPSTHNSTGSHPRLVNAAVPGIKSAKMMHDFGVSFNHTVIMDLPLSLDPKNLAKNKPAVSYDPSVKSRFGVFPRWDPSATRWFETNPCCIFHTANTWDETVIDPATSTEETTAINVLACRLTSASLVFSAGDIAAPIPKASSKSKFTVEEEQCRLYYYRFDLSNTEENNITHEFSLSAIPFEFPSIRADVSMSAARYIYGCSVSDSTFGAALGRAAKIDSIVKIDVTSLISRAQISPPTPIVGCVDNRIVPEILSSQDPNDPIKLFKLPPGVYAQESRFIARKNGTSEDDGWVLFYVFDESQLNSLGDVKDGATSELWVVEAKEMKEIVCKVQLPQRVPYGLHGNWFPEEEILSQRPVESIRSLPTLKEEVDMLGEKNWRRDSWMVVRRRIMDFIG